MSEADDRLVALYLAGDREAGSRLYELHGRRVKAYLLRSGFSAVDADDLTQDIFLRVFRSLHTFDPERGAFGTWLRAVARNGARRAWQKVGSPDDFDPKLAEEVFETNAQEDPALREEIDILKECVSGLAEHYRMLVELRYYKSMTTRGISGRTGTAESTVRLRLEEAMGLLLECMRKKIE